MKPHRFVGSGPGFPCQYVEPRKTCGGQVTNPVHAMLNLKPAAAEAIRKLVPTKPQEQFWPGSACSVWQGHADAVLALLKAKQGYGNAWQEQGYMGNLARILSKASRLKNMLWRDQEDGPDTPTTGDQWSADVDGETVLDTLYDLSALCALAIANIEEGNRWGR